jgi:hypothetical protein
VPQRQENQGETENVRARGPQFSDLSSNSRAGNSSPTTQDRFPAVSCCPHLRQWGDSWGAYSLPSCSHRPSIGLRFSSVCKLTSTRTTTGQPKRLSAQFCVFRRERKLNGQVSGSSPSVKEGTRSSDQGTSSYRRSSCSLRQRHIRREKEPEACPSQLGHGLRLPKERVGQGSEKTQVLRIRQFPCGESENSRQLHERRSPPRKKRDGQG